MADAHHTHLPEDWHRGEDGLHRLRGRDGQPVIVKRRRDAPAGFFAAEARGLAALAAVDGLRTPAVLGLGTPAIALEDLGAGRPSARQWEAAGAALARQHRRGGSAFGFDGDGYVGDAPQRNARDTDGHRFFAEQRLLPQARQAQESRWIDRATLARIERLCGRLSVLLPLAPPVLIHGDLWSGNLHACASGELALIDATAVHYGWAAADLAMLVLFGQPPREFFDAYGDAGGSAGWQDHADLLNLYHLLNHLNLFGTSYRVAVMRVIDRYA